jgi:transposase
MKPRPKRWGGCSSPTSSSTMAFQRTVLDRDPKFTSKFWRALWKRMGSEFKMNTSFRPQTDGQTERVNLVIQQILRNYVAADQQDWVDHLELADFVTTTRNTPQLGPPHFKW